jgi:hypothetical protein
VRNDQDRSISSVRLWQKLEAADLIPEKVNPTPFLVADLRTSVFELLVLEPADPFVSRV